MAVQHIRHWRIGDVQIARIVEVNAFEDNISMLLKDETAEYVRQHAWLRPHFATVDGLMKISFQAFVLRSRGKSVMIDTCISADHQAVVRCLLQPADIIPRGYDCRRLSPRRDQYRCLHPSAFDRVGWNTGLVDGRWVPTFPRARYLFGKPSSITGRICEPPGVITISNTYQIPSTRWSPRGWSTTSRPISR